MALTIKKKAAPEAAPTPTKVAGKVGVGTVTKEYPDGTTKHEDEVVGQAVSASPLASVFVSMGITRNLGNYESVKVNIGITLPCEVDADTIEQTYAEAKSWVDSKVSQVNDEISSEMA